MRGQLSRRGRSMATIFVAGGAEGRNCSRNVPEMFRPDINKRSTVPFQECVHGNGANLGTHERESMFIDYGYVEVGDEVGWYLNMNGPVAGS